MKPIRITLSALALSTVEIYSSEEWDGEDADIGAVCAARRGSGLTVAPDQAELVRRGLIDLANREDAEAEAATNPDERRWARAACEGLSNAAMRLAKAASHP